MLSSHPTFGGHDESKIDTMFVLTAILLEHCQGAVPHQTKHIANLLGKGGESLEVVNFCVSIRINQRSNMLGTMADSDTSIECPQNLACILDITRSIKNTKSTIPVDVFLCMFSSDSIS